MLFAVEGYGLAQHGSGPQAIVTEHRLLPAGAERHQPPSSRSEHKPCLHDMDERTGGIGHQQRHAGIPQQRMQAKGDIGERRPRIVPREDSRCARMIRIERGSAVGQPGARHQAVVADAPAPAFRHLRAHPIGTVGRLAGLGHPVPGHAGTVDAKQPRFLSVARPRIWRRQVIAAVHQLVPVCCNMILFQAHLRVSRTCAAAALPGHASSRARTVRPLPWRAAGAGDGKPKADDSRPVPLSGTRCFPLKREPLTRRLLPCNPAFARAAKGAATKSSCSKACLADQVIPLPAPDRRPGISRRIPGLLACHTFWLQQV